MSLMMTPIGMYEAIADVELLLLVLHMHSLHGIASCWLRQAGMLATCSQLLC
jgi:hypothetical protein